jgi:hypothetical protein
MSLPLRSSARVLVACLGWLAVSACVSPPVASPKPQVVQDTQIRVVPGNKVDVLFMVDNSSSMEPMQAQLRQRFPQFLRVFDDLAAKGFFTDLRIGVVTSDFGAGATDGPSSPGRPYCGHSPGGDLGLLQRKGKAAVNCQGLPDDGPPYILYVYDKNGGTNNLPAGQSLADTFTCMASVGALGCGFEHQLESVWQALKHPDAKFPFVRDDALLAVVFVTNEDDGSAPPDTMIYDANVDAHTYGAYDTYRQTRFGVACGSPLMLAPATASGGRLTDCVSAPNTPMMTIGSEYDVQRYKTLFREPIPQGGVKTDPDDDVLLFAIDGPATPFEVLSVRPQAVPSATYEACGAANDCLVRLQRSCINSTDSGFFADPSVRLNDVVTAVPSHAITSICGDDPTRTPDFSGAMQTLAEEIIKKLPGCIPARIPDVDHPDCVVVQHSADGHGGDQVTSIPQCGSSGPFPCWRLEKKDQCTGPQQLAMTVDRNGAPAPPETHLQVECSTVAESP